MSLKLKKSFIAHWIVLTIMFVFFFQMMSDVIESIYTMDLLNTTLDEKVLGVVFFFTTPILFIFWKKFPTSMFKILGTAAIFFRLLEPFFRTSMKIWIGGLSVGCFLLSLPIYIEKMRVNKPGVMGVLFSLSIASSTLLIILFKTVNATIDISLVGIYQSIGWAMGLTGITLIYLIKDKEISLEIENLEDKVNRETQTKGQNKIFVSITGFFGIIMLLYFAYNSPVIFTRWFETNYFGVVVTLTVMYSAFIAVMLWVPQILLKLKKLYIWIWNFVFVVTLVLMIILNQTAFVREYTVEVVIAYPTSIWLQIITFFNLALSPILFLDVFVFMTNLYQEPIKRGRLIGAFLHSEFVLVVLIFALIFSNVWGYVEPVSLYMRGLIWAPFAVIGVIILLMLGLPNTSWKRIKTVRSGKIFKYTLTPLFLAIVLISSIFAYTTLPHPDPSVDGMGVTSLKIMTYNIQQGVNETGDKNFDAQLELIKSVNPDIIGLQESDTAKINTGNSDVVGYFAQKLDYYVYYGPKSVMQTYGCAILSRYPIQNFYSFYTFGDQDEIGSVFCEVVVGSRVFNVFVNHPAGSDASKLAHTIVMLGLAAPLDNVILLGDFNWREGSQTYNLVNASYLDTWLEIYPTGIGPGGINMTRRIDHVFISDTLFTVDEAVYIPAPESQTDHPAYWTEISW